MLNEWDLQAPQCAASTEPVSSQDTRTYIRKDGIRVYAWIGVSYGKWLNRKHDPCDKAQHDLIGNVQQKAWTKVIKIIIPLKIDVDIYMATYLP